MKGTSLSLCALASLAVHLGLATSLARSARTVRADELARSGAGSTAATSGPAALGGDTFEIAEETPPLEETSAAADTRAGDDGALAEAPPLELDGVPSPAAPALAAEGHVRRGRPAVPGRKANDTEASPPPVPPPAAYGAVGDRAASDLVVTFKRAFPQAGSSDPTWNQVPVGFFAEGDVTFLLSPAGSLTSARVSPAAAPAFRAAIARTVALIKGRAFTARGAETHLHMRVHVSDQLTNHGAFTIDAAGSFELPSGRRVAVTIVERGSRP